MQSPEDVRIKIDFSAQGWGRVFLSTIVGTVLCVGVAVYVDSFNFANMDRAGLVRAILTDVLVPICLAVPLLLFFGSKLRELAIANNRLTVYASTDGLTQIMNRAAFSTLVKAYLEEVRRKEAVRGALLIVDADNFKSINDLYGHDRGDEALILIAQTMHNAVTSPDIVGRLGGEEFGVFLPGAGRVEAEQVGERIRQAVRNAPFSPEGRNHPLTVSIGGAAFAGAPGFSDLFRRADEQLYAAKRAGRDCVFVTPIETATLAA